MQHGQHDNYNSINYIMNSSTINIHHCNSIIQTDTAIVSMGVNEIHVCDIITNEHSCSCLNQWVANMCNVMLLTTVHGCSIFGLGHQSIRCLHWFKLKSKHEHNVSPTKQFGTESEDKMEVGCLLKDFKQNLEFQSNSL